MSEPKKPKRQVPLLAAVLKKIAPKIGVKVEMEPQWGIVGKLTYPNGRNRFFRYTTIDINTMGASEIARDKDYAKFFLDQEGFRVIPGKAFCSKSWAARIGSEDTIEGAAAFAVSLGFPVIVKPNSGSQGYGVTKVTNTAEFKKAFRKISRVDNMILVEKFIVGKDYRIVVLDDKVISAYERIPLSVIGDGKSTILELLHEKQKAFDAEKRDTRIDFKDQRIETKLSKEGLTFESKISKEKKVSLLDNANLSTGGDSVDVTDILHNSIAKLAVSITKQMGLRLCGVDLMLETGETKHLDEQSYWVIEINSAPGLDHYATMGERQEKIVEDLYLEVLKAMGR